MRFLKNNGLSIVFLLLFVFSLAGQVFTGQGTYNEELKEEGRQPVPISVYLGTGHFIQATFENWESEFLQMALFVVLAIFLFQKGSSESKDRDKKEEVEKEPNPKKKDAPWPVKRGGWVLKVYKHSLSLVLLILFLASFVVHIYGSLKDENHQRALKGLPPERWEEYIAGARLWFESFQNWQSEFLSVFAIVVLSIYLRQQGSPQSKPVDAPNSETGG